MLRPRGIIEARSLKIAIKKAKAKYSGEYYKVTNVKWNKNVKLLYGMRRYDVWFVVRKNQ